MMKDKMYKKENRFIVKCDVCKKTIKTNATQIESFMGGRCIPCRKKGL